jgi:hypothetical protein
MPLPPPPERARLHRPDARQPRSWALTPHPTPATVLPRANLDAQGGLDFLSVNCGQLRSVVSQLQRHDKQACRRRSTASRYTGGKPPL